MQLQLFHFLALFLIFCSDNVNFINAKALVGHNSRVADQYEFPFVASIITVSGFVFRPPTDLLCSGVLINGRDIITTERCLKDRQPSQIHVYLGSNDLFHATRHYVDWWITYHDWLSRNDLVVQGYGHDVTILRLASIVTDVEPAILFPQMKDDLVGLEAQVVGWSMSDGPEIPPILVTAPVTLLYDEICSQRIEIMLGHSVEIEPYILCSAAVPTVLINNDDYGGPIMKGNEVIGINKKRSPDTQDDILYPNQVNFHYNIDYYMTFITSVAYDY